MGSGWSTCATRVAFAAGHLAGTLNFGADGSFATYLGWLIPWGTPLTLLAETPQQVAQAQRELVRIGIDRPVAQAIGTPQEWAGGAALLGGLLRKAFGWFVAAVAIFVPAQQIPAPLRTNLYCGWPPVRQSLPPWRSGQGGGAVYRGRRCRASQDTSSRGTQSWFIPGNGWYLHPPSISSARDVRSPRRQ